MKVETNSITPVNNNTKPNVVSLLKCSGLGMGQRLHQNAPICSLAQAGLSEHFEATFDTICKLSF